MFNIHAAFNFQKAFHAELNYAQCFIRSLTSQLFLLLSLPFNLFFITNTSHAKPSNVLEFLICFTYGEKSLEIKRNCDSVSTINYDVCKVPKLHRPSRPVSPVCLWAKITRLKAPSTKE